MKYKVGDKVKVRKDFKTCDTYGGYYVTDNMHKLAGKTVTISDVYECKYVKMTSATVGQTKCSSRRQRIL